jgi:uncharacterized membrane protein YqiK
LVLAVLADSERHPHVAMAFLCWKGRRERHRSVAIAGPGGHDLIREPTRHPVDARSGVRAEAIMIEWIIGGAIGLGLILLALFSGFIRYIPNNRVGIIEKVVSGKGSIKSGLIALAGEAGYEPEVLRGGWHLFMPFMYRIHKVPLVVVPQGQIGYVFARDGRSLPASQALADNAVANNLEDVRDFLAKGGQKGPQRLVLREGSHAINTVQFVVFTADALFFHPLEESDGKTFGAMHQRISERGGFTPVIIRGAEDKMGIVTVHDGPSLDEAEIIAPPVGTDPADIATYHNNFQNPEAFLRAGGRRGRQYQVLIEGTYFINRLFATVELIDKTVVEVGSVGVVVSYTGKKGTDVSGVDFKHGELVEQGFRGVWSEPMMPGKYAFNTCAGKVAMVPTTNFILKWDRAAVGTHKFDENLTEVGLITKDAFEPTLPLSVVIHIDYHKAPYVIQRFGDIKKLVDQTLDPMISAYFKNIGQTKTLIELLQDRAKIQTQAVDDMRLKFADYSLDLIEVLIGTPKGDEDSEKVLAQLRSRQVAREQIETYQQQEKAAAQERQLREAEARAQQQTLLTASEVSIAVKSNEGKAALAAAEQEAAKIRTLAQANADQVQMVATGEARRITLTADADAKRIRVTGEAEADKTARVGIAQAMAIEEQVRAYGGPQYQMTQQVMGRFAEAIEKSKVDVVPRIMMGGSDTANGGSFATGLLNVLMAQNLGVQSGVDFKPAEASEESKKVRAAIMGSISKPNDDAASADPAKA